MKFIHMKSFIYGHIHPCGWIKITLSFKLQAPSLGFGFTHKPSSICLVLREIVLDYAFVLDRKPMHV